MKKKFRNTQEFIDAASRVHGGIYTYNRSEYTSMREKVVITCPEHGDFLQPPYQHLQGQGCRKCRDKMTGERSRLTQAAFLEKCVEVHGDRYDLSRICYTRTNDKIEVICREHGAFFPVAGNFIYRASNCPRCKYEQHGLNSRLGSDVYMARFKALHGDRYEYLDIYYEGSQAFIRAKCPDHGVFTIRVQDHLRGFGCAKCSRVYDTPSFVEKAVETHGHKYDYSKSIYIDAHTPLTIVCPEHGDFSQRPSDHASTGQGCPRCGGTGPSTGQVEINEFLSQFVETEMEHSIGKKRVDILIPSLSIGIEYHGLIWHSTRFHADPLNLHHKHQLAARAGIRLVHIFQDEWEQRSHAVKNLLRSLVGVSERRFARNCHIVELSERDLDYHRVVAVQHIQGAVGGGGLRIFALYEGSKPVAAMVFSPTTSDRARVRDGSVWELRRYASVGTVVGGASKLFTHFLRTCSPSEVVSYSDIRLFTGRLYETLGFQQDAVSRPSYCYITPGVVKRFNKSRFQLKNLPGLFEDKFDPTLTEASNCANNGWYQLYDCGKVRWVWHS